MAAPHNMKAATCFALLLLSGSARGYCSRPSPRVCSEFAKSQLVVRATVFKIEKELETSGPDKGEETGTWFHLRISESFKGDAGHTLRVYTPNDSGRFMLELDHAYLLFIGKDDSNGRFRVWPCSQSSDILDPAAKKVLSDIRTVLKARMARAGGSIRGEVFLTSPASQGVGGIVFTISGRGLEQRVTSDASGWFTASVPPGTYTIAFHSGGYSVTPFDLSYDDPSLITIESGGGAEVAFCATPTPQNRIRAH